MDHQHKPSQILPSVKCALRALGPSMSPLPAMALPFNTGLDITACHRDELDQPASCPDRTALLTSLPSLLRHLEDVLSLLLPQALLQILSPGAKGKWYFGTFFCFSLQAVELQQLQWFRRQLLFYSVKDKGLGVNLHPGLSTS